MLTRLKVNGFKNLVDVDVRFGPFTCVAGANGVGKSNLLDAIAFMSALADRPLIDAALGVRDEGGRMGDLRSIFHRANNQYADEMSFEAEMIVPAEGADDLGQVAKASITFLRYKIRLGYVGEATRGTIGRIELLHEELAHIKIGDAKKSLPFPHTVQWRKSAIVGQRRTPWFISTDIENEARVIKIHQDGGSSGKPRPLLASNLPRTAVSAANAAESPTAMLAKREMQSWRRLQLEPTALRRPDAFAAPTELGVDGSHLPAVLYRLAGSSDGAKGGKSNSSDVYSTIADRLSRLIDDVRSVVVDRDDKRELLTLQVTGRDRTPHAARALSDGTLRFLALAVIEVDPHSWGLLCLEEPENGIHPARIPAMLDLLQDIATDSHEPVGRDNPLRQVIINTHSPAVVAQVPDDSLLMAETRSTINNGRRFDRLAFSCLPQTWRSSSPERMPVVPKGRLMAYLNPVEHQVEPYSTSGLNPPPRRVIDRDDLQMALFGSEGLGSTA